MPRAASNVVFKLIIAAESAEMSRNGRKCPACWEDATVVWQVGAGLGKPASAVPETGVSRHHGGQFKGPL